jgi:hypothetical protein
MAAALCLTAAVSPHAHSHETKDPLLSRADAQRLAHRIVARKKDPDGWGRDIWHALEMNGIAQKKSNVCAVMAVIEQESTFTANPEVRGLGKMAEGEIMAKLESVPVLPGAASHGVKWFLENRPTPDKSYLSLIRAARTERDLDLVFRNIAYYLFKEYASTRLLNTAAIARRVDRINPVSTIGSMQVSVAYAVGETERREDRSLPLERIWQLRDHLYSRAGGIDFGTRILLGYYAGYDTRLHVFADFNAGRYASRNAAFQHMVSALGGTKLALDGDLLLYESGIPSAKESGTEKAVRALKTGLSDKDIRGDLLNEKQYKFRETETYRRVSALYRKKTGKAAPYAMIPQIRLESPKLSKTMTTERFARAVMARYERCLKIR